MQAKNSSLKIIIGGVLASAALTAVIGLTSAGLTNFEIVGPTVPFAYAWRLMERSDLARLTAWLGYIIHNLIVWGLIWYAKRGKPKYTQNLHWFNWTLIGVNLLFTLLHVAQTQLWYDGLAQDVPEITALGSVALMLMIIIILETPRRGLIFGGKFKFQQAFIQIVRQYHGYLFSWAVIYTFWYHPTEGTLGHLMGFFYMFMLFTQSTLIFNRTHINKWWTFALEAFVIIHGVTVAIFQGNDMWPMFAFGFGAMIVLTQMYGLGLNGWAKRGLAAAFVIAVVASYAIMGRFGQLNEVIRIPVLDYLVVFLIYGIYLGLNWIVGLFNRSTPAEAGTD